MDSIEMKGFMAVVVNMGIVQLNDMKEYWSTSVLIDISFFRNVLSRDRFFQILGVLHVGEINGRNKESKIQPFIDIILPKFQSTYILHLQVAIDESVINFKGRVSFRQYLKGKPHPWGIKAFVLADSITGYVQNLTIYYGRDTDLICPDLPVVGRHGTLGVLPPGLY